MNLQPAISLTLAVTLASACGILSAEAQTNRPAANDFSAFQIITDRNIFDPNRRPRVVVQTQTRPRPRTVVDSFSYHGTMSYDGQGPFAVFSGTQSEYHKVLERGARIGGHTIAEIGFDHVKLVSGTNAIELKVGAQMRRSDDGTWTVGQQSELGSGFASVGTDFGRSDRRSEFNRGGGRTSFRGNQTSQQESTVENASPANLDPGDPVARLMLRRLQEVGGGAPGANGPDATAPETNVSFDAVEERVAIPTEAPAAPPQEEGFVNGQGGANGIETNQPGTGPGNENPNLNDEN
jgi:hypothetical protein